jgi:hypothetical protein
MNELIFAHMKLLFISDISDTIYKINFSFLSGHLFLHVVPEGIGLKLIICENYKNVWFHHIILQFLCAELNKNSLITIIKPVPHFGGDTVLGTSTS